MVWFFCDHCGDSIRKPKLANHYKQCKSQTFTCVDCSRQFDRTTAAGHNTCVSEHDKYALGATKPGGFAADGFFGDKQQANGQAGGTGAAAAASEPVGLQFLATTPPWVCSVCNVTCTSRETLEGHATGVKHKRRAKAATRDASGGEAGAQDGDAAAAGTADKEAGAEQQQEPEQQQEQPEQAEQQEGGGAKKDKKGKKDKKKKQDGDEAEEAGKQDKKGKKRKAAEQEQEQAGAGAAADDAAAEPDSSQDTDTAAAAAAGGESSKKAKKGKKGKKGGEEGGEEQQQPGSSPGDAGAGTPPKKKQKKQKQQGSPDAAAAAADGGPPKQPASQPTPEQRKAAVEAAVARAVARLQKKGTCSVQKLAKFLKQAHRAQLEGKQTCTPGEAKHAATVMLRQAKDTLLAVPQVTSKFNNEKMFTLPLERKPKVYRKRTPGAPAGKKDKSKYERKKPLGVKKPKKKKGKKAGAAAVAAA